MILAFNNSIGQFEEIDFFKSIFMIQCESFSNKHKLFCEHQEEHNLPPKK